MKIRVNGKEKIIELENEKALLSSTLEFLGYKQNTVVVEVNDLITVSYTHLTLPTNREV